MTNKHLITDEIVEKALLAYHRANAVGGHGIRSALETVVDDLVQQARANERKRVLEMLVSEEVTKPIAYDNWENYVLKDRGNGMSIPTVLEAAKQKIEEME